MGWPGQGRRRGAEVGWKGHEQWRAVWRAVSHKVLRLGHGSRRWLCGGREHGEEWRSYYLGGAAVRRCCTVHHDHQVAQERERERERESAVMKRR